MKHLVKILIIDDELYIRKFLMTEFCDKVEHSYPVGAETIYFALASIEEECPDWIILDPGLSETEDFTEQCQSRLIVFDRIRQAAPKSKIIILTGRDNQQEAELLVSFGCTVAYRAKTGLEFGDLSYIINHPDSIDPLIRLRRTTQTGPEYSSALLTSREIEIVNERLQFPNGYKLCEFYEIIGEKLGINPNSVCQLLKIAYSKLVKVRHPLAKKIQDKKCLKKIKAKQTASL